MSLVLPMWSPTHTTSFDQTVALVTAFYLYMALYPDVQRKAQAEIDEVVGQDRLPSMGDERRLPYVDSLIKELHRFNPIVPLIPHSTSREDEYHGYRIPKGAWIMANSWYLFSNDVYGLKLIKAGQLCMIPTSFLIQTGFGLNVILNVTLQWTRVITLSDMAGGAPHFTLIEAATYNHILL